MLTTFASPASSAWQCLGVWSGGRYYVYTYPSRKAIKAVTHKVKTICRRNVNQPLQTLIRRLNPALRGWCAYFKPGVSSVAFSDLANYTLDRFLRWARRKHRRITV